MNILGYELLSIIKNFLDCKVSVENCYIVFENNLDFLYTTQKMDLSNFNFTVHLKNMEFKANDIRQHLTNGVFKGYMNLQKFQEQSGIIG